MTRKNKVKNNIAIIVIKKIIVVDVIYALIENVVNNKYKKCKFKKIKLFMITKNVKFALNNY